MNSRCPVLPLVLIAAPFAIAGQAAPVPNAAAVLDANHVAVGALPARGTAEFEFIHTGSGLTGTAQNRFDLTRGGYVEIEEAQGMRSGDGYDGHTPWQLDISGTYTAQEGGDRLPMAVDRAYRYGNRWWQPDRGGAQVNYVARETVGSRAMDHLSIAPRGGKPFDAWFDADTHLLAKVAYDQQFFHHTETYQDYRREGGVALAHRTTIDSGVGEGGIETWSLTKASLGPARSMSVYTRPGAPPLGAAIVGGAPSTTVPFRLLNNHIYLQASVNGQGPFTFIVDTGGHTLLSPNLVKRVGLKAVGQAVSSGAGVGHDTTGFVHFDEIAIGGVRLTNQTGFATKIYDPAVEGIAVDGMVGFELIRRLVTTIDYGRHTVTFTDPKRFKPGPELGTAVPFVFYDHLPFVAGSVDGLATHWDIDTGSRSQIDLTRPFVTAHGLKTAYPRGVSAVVGWGVGGPSRSYVVRLTSLRLGSVEVRHVAAGLVEDRGGSLSDPNYDGNVGSGLLKQFVVTFDYAHQIMYLKLITPTPPDVGTFDRSGLWINAAEGGFAVTDVAKDGPGDQAGLRVGDVITAIDGRPAVADHLAEIRLKLRDEPPGTTVALTIRRGDESHAATLTLRDQI